VAKPSLREVRACFNEENDPEGTDGGFYLIGGKNRDFSRVNVK
jgi:hypothetical protein